MKWLKVSDPLWFSKRKYLKLSFVIFFVLTTFHSSAVWGIDCSPKYTPLGQIKRIDAKDFILNVTVEDSRNDKDKYYFLWTMGWKSWDPDAAKLNGGQKLFLTSKPKDIIRKALSDSFSNAGYKVSDQIEGTKLRIKLKKFLYTLDPMKNGPIGVAEIGFTVLVEKDGKSYFSKDFYDRSHKQMNAFRQVEDAEPMLSQSLSKIAEDTAIDVDLRLAILGTRQETAAKAKPVETIESSERTQINKTISKIPAVENVKSGVNTQIIETDFVIKFVKDLPHRFPEGNVKGVWLSSVPTGLEVFVFPNQYGNKFKVFSEWATNKTETRYHLGKTPLLVELKQGIYNVLFVHPLIKKGEYTVKFGNGNKESTNIETQTPLSPFIAQKKPAIYAILGDLYFTEEREIEVKNEDAFETAIALFQRDDQTVVDMLKNMPAEESFTFSSADMFRDPNKIASKIDKARVGLGYDLLSPQSNETISFALTQEEIADADKMIKRCGIWGKKFSESQSLSIEVKPKKKEWYTLKYIMTIKGTKGNMVQDFVWPEYMSEQKQVSNPVTTNVLSTPSPTTQPIPQITPQQSLHKAAEQNDIALIKSLIEKGANVNEPDSLGWSPLHFAAYKGSNQAAEVLLSSGALLEAKANNDVRPLHLAGEQGQTALVELLLGKGADVNARQAQGWTPLGLAASNCHFETCKLLLDKGAELNSKSKSGLTPLHTAVSKGCREVVELLLSKGAEVNSKSNNGRTPLHTAAYQNQQESAKLLLSAGADPNVKDIEGKTPVDFATQFGNETIAKLLAKTTESHSAGKQPKTSAQLSLDGVYSKDAGSGGSYKDPIHGFFEVEPPKGFKIAEDRNRTTMTLDDGTSAFCSRITFQSDNAKIAVITRKSFRGTIEEDLKVVVYNYRSAGAEIRTERFITIDGTKGAEVGAIAAGYQLLLIKYKKHGLDHAITMSCSPADFPKHQKEFMDFLRSYRSLNSEWDVKQADGERPEISADLPADGVYSKDAGSGGNYKDPINGFFVVQAPAGFEIKERLDKTKFIINEGSSHIGETVPSSFIQFICNNKTFIAVTARKTFTSIEHDFDVILAELPKKFSGIKIYPHRFVTIDGVKGGEVLSEYRGQKMLMVKYKKYGLDHSITINCDETDFPKFEDIFVAFLRSYRSLSSDQDVKQADEKKVTEVKGNIDTLHVQEMVDKYDLSTDQKKIAISYFKEQPCVYTTTISGSLKGTDNFLIFMQRPEQAPMKITAKSPQSCVVDFARLYVAPKKSLDIASGRCVLISFAAVQHPSSKSEDDLLVFVGFHDPRFNASAVPTIYLEAAPAPSFSPGYLSLFPKEFSAVFFVGTEAEANDHRSMITAISRNKIAEEFEKKYSPQSNLIEVKVAISEQ